MRPHRVLGILLLSWAATAHATVRNVPVPYATIQSAVDACAPGDIVKIAAGVYDDCVHVAGDGDTTKCVVVLRDRITLRGSGMGQTILDANSLGRGIHGSGIEGAVIESLTVRESFAATHGAGIFLKQGSSPRISACEITGNLDGGIILMDGSSPMVINSQITNNAGKEGGGVAIYTGSSPAFSNCTITGNQAPSGAGVFIRENCAPWFTGCLVAGNTVVQANGSGGGFTIVNASPLIEDTRIEDNVATGSGGGVAMSESIVRMTRCVIQGNSTTGSNGAGGGLFVDYASDATIENCTIVRNTVSGGGTYADGGGVCAFGANALTLRQCTIAANATARYGGGIAIIAMVPSIEKSIVAFNSPGRGIYCGAGGAASVSCTDVYGNAAGDDICGSAPSGTNFSLDPVFCSLAGDDYRLQAASPCAPGNHPQGPGACDGSRLGALGVGCGTVTGAGDPAAPPVLRVQGNSPNPFHPSTEIRFATARSGWVTLRVFDVGGRQVRLLTDALLPSGEHVVRWDGRIETGQPAPSGLYFYEVALDGTREARRMILAR